MHRSKIFGGLALASMLLVVLTGCPSVITNVVGTNESVDQAVAQADPGDTVKVMGTHEEDVDVETDDVTITGEDGATIEGEVVIDADNVTIENLTITEELDTVPGSFQNLTLNNVTVEAWNNAAVSGTFSCNTILQPSGDIQSLIDNSSSGDALCVASDTYNGSLTIGTVGNGDKTDLTLAGIGNPVVKGSGGTQDAAILLDDDHVDVHDVTIRGFTIKNPDGRYGIHVGSLEPADIDNVTIEDSVIDGVGQNTVVTAEVFAIKVEGNSDNVLIQGNTIRNVESGNFNRATGIHLGSKDSVTPNQNGKIINNTIENVSATGTDNKARAIRLSEYVEGAQIENNTITSIGSSSTDYAQGITVTEDKDPNPSVGPTNFTITGNTIKNLIAGGDYNGHPRQVAIFIGGYSDLGDHHGVEKNNILDGAVDRCCGDMAENLLAINNWWGDASGPSTSDDKGDFPGKLDPGEFAEDSDTGEKADGNGTPVVKRHDKEANIRFDPWANSAF